jgi:hypothetical protein
MTESTADNPALGLTPTDVNLRWAIKQIEEALRGLQFGTITLVVQDGMVVQVERTEKRRYQLRKS